MPERKIKDWRVSNVSLLDICRDPDHEPATLIYREPGTYEHTCPSCGATVTFNIPKIMML